MITLRWLAIAGALVLCAGMVEITNVQAAASGPSAALYCRGPLSTARTEGGKVIRTTFKWAKEAATKENPGPGECAWADHAPQGTEKAGDTGSILGNLGPFDNLPPATFGKLCVSMADSPSPGQNDDLVVRQIVRQLGHQTAPFHLPPFSGEGCTS